MTITNSGCLTAPMGTLRTMLSYSSAWQAWIEEEDDSIPASGAARATYAEAYIHDLDYKKPESGGYVYPAAIIEVPDNVEYSSIALGTHSGGNGMLDLLIVRKIPAALLSDPDAAWMEFAGQDEDGVKTGIGPIMNDLINSEHVSPDFFSHFSLALTEGPYHLSESKQARMGKLMGARLSVTWGYR